MIGRKIIQILNRNTDSKNTMEIHFWNEEIAKYINWYDGEIDSLYNTKAPTNDEKVFVYCKRHSAILTWLKLHQQVKYLKDLSANENDLSGLKVLDIGSGPMPSATVFKGVDLYCLDPLLGKYIDIGFPIHYYENVKFICSHSEKIPFEDNYFDLVISVNAIDHVDNLRRTSLEIKRVLKEQGRLRMHVHYHKAMICEPIELNDTVISNNFNWCEGLKKISETNQKMGYTAPEGESFAVWSNY